MLTYQRKQTLLVKLAQTYPPLNKESGKAVTNPYVSHMSMERMTRANPTTQQVREAKVLLDKYDKVKKWSSGLSRAQRSNLNQLWKNRRSAGGMAKFRAAYRQSIGAKTPSVARPQLGAKAQSVNIRRPLDVPSAGKVARIPRIRGFNLSR